MPLMPPVLKQKTAAKSLTVDGLLYYNQLISAFICARIHFCLIQFAARAHCL
jgi:hypothetical protein